MSFITARFVSDPLYGAPHWRIDGCVSTRAQADRWAAACRNDAGVGPATIVLAVPDDAEAFALYMSGRMTIREADLMARVAA